MSIKLVCASLLLGLLLGCQGLRPRSAEGLCQASGFPRGTDDFDSCVQRKREEGVESRVRQYQIRSHGTGR